MATQSQFSNEEISRIVSSMDIPIPANFSRWWLKRLIRSNDWSYITKHYSESKHAATQCHVARALFHLEKHEELDSAIRNLWLVGKSQTKECDSVFKIGFDNGFIGDNLIFERILLTKARNNAQMSNYLAGLLKTSEFKTWVKHLNAVHLKPKAQISRNFSDWSHSRTGRSVIQHGIVRMARRDISKAATFWNELREKDSAAVARMPDVERTIAIRLAFAQHQDSFDWLSNLPNDLHDNKSLRLMARSALAAENWDGLLFAIELMPPEEAGSSNWQYWRAHVLHEQGDDIVANHIWSDLASENSYYGFLAADRLSLPYAFEKPVKPIELDQLRDTTGNTPAMPRIREWLALNKPYSARRELFRLKSERKDDEQFWSRASKQFHLWGWHDGAIQASRLGDLSYLQLSITHPSPYLDTVRKESLRHGVSIHWIYSIMRQESNFVRDIRSGAGATGLMQLMPSTARITAKRIGLKRPKISDLQRAELNIRLGVAYFRQLLNRMNNNPIHALAGYNAGPSRSEKWRESFRAADPAIWVETIVFNETRNYVKKILVNNVIYRQIHNSVSTRVRDHLQISDIQRASSSE